jgi:hypothetical protein
MLPNPESSGMAVKLSLSCAAATNPSDEDVLPETPAKAPAVTATAAIHGYSCTFIDPPVPILAHFCARRIRWPAL